jgi:RND family efflux transporter MFP subunit
MKMSAVSYKSDINTKYLIISMYFNCVQFISKNRCKSLITINITNKLEYMSNLKILTVLLLFLGLATGSCNRNSIKNITEQTNDSTIVNDDKQKVSVMLLRYGDFNKEIMSNGKLVALKKADLKFRSSENVAEVLVKNGDRVIQGQVIAKLDNFTLSNTLKKSRYQFEKAKIELQDVLISQGYNNIDTTLIPGNTMKTARGRSGIDAALAELEMAEYNFRASVLRAPFSGIVANLFSKENNLSNQSEEFCTIIDDSRFEAEFPVLESELSSVKQGQTVRIIPFSNNDIEVKGEIIKINPVVDQNGMVKVNAVCTNDSHKLFEGMNVKIVLEDKVPHQLVIPKQAVVLRSEKQVVFTYSAGRAKWVYIKTGLENISSFVVTEGLQEGDSVIYEGNLNLAHDTGVIIDQ